MIVLAKRKYQRSDGTGKFPAHGHPDFGHFRGFVLGRRRSSQGQRRSNDVTPIAGTTFSRRVANVGARCRSWSLAVLADRGPEVSFASRASCGWPDMKRGSAPTVSRTWNSTRAWSRTRSLRTGSGCGRASDGSSREARGRPRHQCVVRP